MSDRIPTTSACFGCRHYTGTHRNLCRRVEGFAAAEWERRGRRTLFGREKCGRAGKFYEVEPVRGSMPPPSRK